MYCLLRGEKDQTHGPKPLLLRRVGIKLNLASNKFLGLLLSLQRHPSNSGRMVPHYRSYEKVAVRSHPLPRRGNGNGTTYGPPAIRHESIALEESFLKQWAQVLHQFGAVLALNKNQPCVVRYTPTKITLAPTIWSGPMGSAKMRYPAPIPMTGVKFKKTELTLGPTFLTPMFQKTLAAIPPKRVI